MSNEPQMPVKKEASPMQVVRARIDSLDFKSAVAKALPKHLTPDRFLRVAITALTRTPKLAECDQPSFFGALLTLSQLGIEPDGRRAHLIPFKNSKRDCYEVQLIIDYKGLAELAMRSGMVSNLHSDVVCENDSFEYDRGVIKTHKIDFRQSRGEPYAAYSLARMKDGSEAAVVMGKDEIEAIRRRSKSANNGPWVTDWNEMAKKTTFKRLSKWLTLSPEFRDAVAQDEDTDVIDVDGAAEVVEPPRPKRGQRATVAPPVVVDPEPVPPNEPTAQPPLVTTPLEQLEEFLTENHVTFDQIKEVCILNQSMAKRAELWTRTDDVDTQDVTAITTGILCDGTGIKWKTRRGGAM